MYSFSNLEPVHCFMSGSNCCFLTCIQVSQEARKAVWYSHFFQNFPQFTVIHSVKGFSIVNEAEVDVFLEFPCFMIQWMLAIWSLVPLLFLNPACTSRSSWFTYSWSLAWRILSFTLLGAKWVQLSSSLSFICHCPSLGLEWKLTFSSRVFFMCF